MAELIDPPMVISQPFTCGHQRNYQVAFPFNIPLFFIALFLSISLNFVRNKLLSPESPVQLLFGRSTRCDADSKKELFEVNVAVSIRVEGSKDVVAEVPGIATWKTLAVYLHKSWRAKLSVGTIRNETLVPLLQFFF